VPGKDLGVLERIGKQYHLQAGVRLLAGSDPVGALREFEAALGIDPGDSAVYVEKARALGAIGRWDQAVEALRDAIAGDPGSGDLHRALGAAFESCGRYGEAAEAYGEAARLLADPSDAHTALERVSSFADRHPVRGQDSSCFEDIPPGDGLTGAWSGERVIVREVVRIPCQYCGTLVDITRTTCQSCGAPLQ